MNQGDAATPVGVITGVGFSVPGYYGWGIHSRQIQPGASVDVHHDGDSSNRGYWIPSSGGGYTVTAKADDVDRYAESDEENNARAYEFSVGGGPSAPDVVVTDVWTTPANPLVGDQVQFHAVVKNQGNAATPAGVITGVGFSVPGYYGWGTHSEQIPPGESVEVHHTSDGDHRGRWTPTFADTYTLWAGADDINRYPESNEGNNWRSHTFTVRDGGGDLPDVVVSRVWITPAEPRVGDEVQFHAEITNRGGAPTPEGVVTGVGFAAPGYYGWGVRSESISAGQTVTVHLTSDWQNRGRWIPDSAGAFTLWAGADDINRYPESDDSNNWTSLTMSVTAEDGGGGDFARRSGAGFSYGGGAYKFIGVNLRGLAHRDGSEIRRQLEAASAMGVRVLRIFIAQNGASNDTVGQRLGNIIDVARDVDPELKFIVVLTDFYNNSGLWVNGDGGYYSRDAGGYSVLNHEWFRSGFRENYKPFVGSLVSGFSSTPEVFAWELGNELQSGSADDMLSFVYEMGSYIEDLGAEQMITTGFISSHHAAGGNYSGRSLAAVIDDFYRNYDGENTPVDFLSVHGYNNDWAPGKPNQVEADRNWAAGRIPDVVGEFGFSGGFSGQEYCEVFGGEWWDSVWLPGTSGSRGTTVQRAADHFFDLGADGLMQWGFMAGENHDNGEGDSCFGMDKGKFHGDWDDLFGYYSAKAGALP
jgi:hypothetical protein